MISKVCYFFKKSLTWFDAVDVVVVPDEAKVVVTDWTGESSFETTFVGDVINTDVGANDVTGATFEVVTELIDDVLRDIVCRTHGSSGIWWLVVTVVGGAGATVAVGAGALAGAAAVAGTEFRWWAVGEDWIGIRVWKSNNFFLSIRHFYSI